MKCSSVGIALAPAAGLVQVRRDVRDQLTRWGRSDLAEDSLPVVSESPANAYGHGSAPVRLSQVKRRLDLRGLRLRPFSPGKVAHTPNLPVRLVDPTRPPVSAGPSLSLPALPAGDLAALTALTARDALLPAGPLKRRPDRSTSDALSRAGLSDAVVARILRPFLFGVFLEDRLETSARFFHTGT